MANQVGPDIAGGTAAQPGQFAGPEPASGDVASAFPGTAAPGTAPSPLSDTAFTHEAFHGRPVSWVAVCLILAGFLTGGLSLVFKAWPGFWTGAGLVVIGALLAAASDIFEDWY